MTKITTQSSRSVEVPNCPVLSVWKSALWFFTTEGRAQHSLILAHKYPDDARRLATVERAAAGLHTNFDQLSETGKSLLEALFYYIAWRSLGNSSFSKATEALLCLDKLAPLHPSVPPMRLALMDALFAQPNDDGYLHEAEIFLADSRAISEEYASDVLNMLDRVYTRMGQTHCKKLLEKTHPIIQRRDKIQTAIALCACPAVIELQTVFKQIKTADLDFSALMMVDAHLVNARLAEYRGNKDEMLSSCQKAFQLAPAHHPVSYWLTRANLYRYSRQRDPAAHAADVEMPDDPAWRRLKLYVAIHRDLGVRTAAALNPVLSGQLGEIGPAETRLIAGLIQLALTNKPDATAFHNLGVVAELCQLVQKKAKVSPWSQYFIAYKEILIDEQYGAACVRLETKDELSYPGTKELYRVARIMRGEPLAVSESGEDDALTAIEKAMHLLFLPVPAGSAFSSLLEHFNACEPASIAEQFPAAKDAVMALSLALQVVSGNLSTTGQDLRSNPPAESSPNWVLWLHARLLLLTRDIRYSGSLRSERNSYLDSNTKDDLGFLLESVCVKESQIESDFASARAALTKAAPKEAIKILNALRVQTESASILTVMLWRPLVTYWLGVAYAHAQDDKAAEVLRPLVGGPLGDEATGQLALLAFQHGDIFSAAQHLEYANDRVPSVRYAKAVLLSRTGKPDEACQVLMSDEAIHSMTGSPYALASKRLIAAINERCNRAEEGIRLYQEILSTHPDDEVSILRLVRDGLQTAYGESQTGNPTVDVPCAGILAELVPKSRVGIAQKTAYSRLLDLLTKSFTRETPEPLSQMLQRQIQNIDTQISERVTRIWWRQLLASKLVRSGKYVDARKVLDTSDHLLVPPAVARSQTILKIWEELNRMANQSPNDKSAKTLGKQARALKNFGAEDPTVNLWRIHAEFGASMAKGESVPAENWRILGDSPISRIPFLFDGSSDKRRIAAETILPDIDTDHSSWNEIQRLLLSAIIAWAMEKDDWFLEHYNKLGPVLDDLPVPGRDLWVAAALVQHAKKDLNGLLDNIPDCVADMSDPLVKLAVELASARLVATDVLKNGPRDKALKDIKRVRDNLRDLLDVADAAAPQSV